MIMDVIVVSYLVDGFIVAFVPLALEKHSFLQEAVRTLFAINQRKRNVVNMLNKLINKRFNDVRTLSRSSFDFIEIYDFSI